MGNSNMETETRGAGRRRTQEVREDTRNGIREIKKTGVRGKRMKKTDTERETTRWLALDYRRAGNTRMH